MARGVARLEPPVLIFGSHIAALGVLRVLTAQGIRCQVVDETNDIITRSRWYRPAERTLAETSDAGSLTSYLESLAIPSAVLIACSDVWTLAVAGLEPEVRRRFMVSVPPLDAVEQCIDKARFAQLTERLDIPRPRTVHIRTEADLDAISPAELEAGFLKPVESHRYYRHFGTKGQFASSRREALEAVRVAATQGIEFLFQEWIPGNMSKTILLDGFVDRTGRVAAISARRRVRMDPPKIAATHCDVTIRLTDVKEAVRNARQILEALAYRGVFSVEYKFDERDGHFKVIEVNARPFWLIAHIARAGNNLPWLSYLDAQELPVPALRSYRVGRYGMYEIPEIAALARAWSQGRRPEGPVLRPWLLGDHTLLYASDPLPGIVDISRSVRRRLRGLLAGPAPASRPI